MIKYILNEYEGIDNKSNVIHLESNFEKVAYQFGDPIKEYIENKVKPTKGSNYYLINSMGSGEIYGSNTRGDYFPRKELKENHKTFESTPACVYVQHRNKDRNIRLGDVLFSHFNDDTDRVELVQKIDWDRVFKYAPDWVRALLQTNSPYNTSMGCTVDHEYCNYCGKKNKLMNQRCDHLARRMNQFVDGTKIMAFNIKPKFFDNSIVMRGADKIARSMKKVASDPYVDEILNAEETIMNDSELSGKSYFLINSKMSNKVDILPESKIAFIREETFDKIAEESFHLSKEFIGSLLDFELEDILGVTKIAGAELLPHEYQYIVLKKLGQDAEAERRWNYGIRFKLQDGPTDNIEKLALGYNKELLSKFAECIPFKSNWKPFVFYRGLSKIASEQSPINWTIVDEPVLSRAYADYICKDMEKVADLSMLMPFLSAVFLTLPSLLALQKSTDRTNKVEIKNIKMVQDIKNRASEIPMLPFLPNPVYHNPLFQSNLGTSAKPVYIVNNPIKTASVGNKILGAIQGGATSIKNKAPITFHYTAPIAAAGATTIALAGKDKQKEQQGDPSTGTGLYGFAHKHPKTTMAAGALLGHMATRGLVKKSSSQDLSNYKEFLKTANQEQLLEFLGKIPDDLFFDLIN
jgi:hypothetical protein